MTRCEAMHENNTVVAMYNGERSTYGPAEVGLERCDLGAGHGGAHSSESPALVSIWFDDDEPMSTETYVKPTITTTTDTCILIGDGLS